MRYILCLLLLALAVTVFAIDSNPKTLPLEVSVAFAADPVIVAFEAPEAPYALKVRSNGGGVMVGDRFQQPLLMLVPPVHEATLCIEDTLGETLYLGVANVTGQQRVTAVVSAVDYEAHCETPLSDKEM